MMDVANLGRRVRCGMARMILSSLQDGDKSDEDEEEDRMADTFQQMLTLASSLSERSKMKIAEMISRSSVTPMRSLPGIKHLIN